jgi:hypothetical protein
MLDPVGSCTHTLYSTVPTDSFPWWKSKRHFPLLISKNEENLTAEERFLHFHLVLNPLEEIQTEKMMYTFFARKIKFLFSKSPF